MKKITPLFTAFACVISSVAFAQSTDRTQQNSMIKSANLRESANDVAILYHVEERINMPFGGSITTYEVSKKSLIATNELGPSNRRIITPKYAKANENPVEPVTQLPRPAADYNLIKAPINHPVMVATEPAKKYVNVDILDTYEHVLEKGYKSADMLRRVANAHFFDDELIAAEKWYSVLFKMNTDIETVLYYRYAQSLKAVGNTVKAAEMMRIFEEKNK